ncbi:hypothetical protein D3A96_15170 [Robertkochia marina]|nr:hypothetical protein D3A96_15170 [Robertkochia marina]
MARLQVTPAPGTTTDRPAHQEAEVLITVEARLADLLHQQDHQAAQEDPVPAIPEVVAALSGAVVVAVAPEAAAVAPEVAEAEVVVVAAASDFLIVTFIPIP